jgi:hypothetical protein
LGPSGSKIEDLYDPMPNVEGWQDTILKDDIPDNTELHVEATESREAGKILPNNIDALEKIMF